MSKITEMKILFRERVELPNDLELATEEFCKGWNHALALDARSLENMIQKHGWNFVRSADGSLRSGVGESSQEAITSALTLSLRRVSTLFNAVEVEHIDLSQYPWFYLARVRIFPIRIQQDSVMPLPEDYVPLSEKPRQRRLPISASALYPNFGSAVPELKQMLVLSKTAQGRPQ